jgi:hypothetical protein
MVAPILGPRTAFQGLCELSFSMLPRSTLGRQFGLRLLSSVSLGSGTGDCLIPGQAFMRQFGPKISDRGLRLFQGSLCVLPRRCQGSNGLAGGVELVGAGFAMRMVIQMDDGYFAISNETVRRSMRPIDC